MIYLPTDVVIPGDEFHLECFSVFQLAVQNDGDGGAVIVA